MKLTKINDKWDILLPDHRADRKEWPWWEQERLQSMNETIKKGDVVYYVGSEAGDLAGLLSMWGAKLVLFEPNSMVWPNAKKVWEYNNLSKPLAFYYGFASDETKNGDGLLADWPSDADKDVIPNFGFKELVADDPEIPQTRIDDLENKIPPPDMITLDVEGAEGRVLRGAEQTLRKYKPRIYLSLHHEFLHQNYGELHFDLCNWIKSLGYKETVIGNQPHEAHLVYERA